MAVIRRVLAAYRHLSILTQLLVSILGTAVPLIVLVFYGLWSSSQVIYQQTGQAFIANLTQSSIRVGELKKNVEAVSLFLSIDGSLNSKLLPGAHPVEEYARHRDVSDSIFAIDRTYPGIDSIHILNAADGLLYSSYHSAVTALTNFGDYRFYSDALLARGTGVWLVSDLIDSPILEEMYAKPMISFTRLLNMEQRAVYGLNNVASVNVSPLIFQAILTDAGDGFEEVVLRVAEAFAIGRERGVLSTPGEVDEVIADATDATGFFTTRVGTQDIVYYYSRIEPGWYLVAYTPLSEVLAGTLRNRIISILSAVLIAAFGVGTAYVLQSHLNRPLHVLMSHMQQVHDGDLDAMIHEQRDDEFGVTYRMFNEMTSKLRVLAHDVYQEGERTREAEFLVMQSQISPHFLYNSLDTIYWMAERARAPEIAQMAMWLGRFYRLNLSKGRDMISIDQMVEQISSYLNVQQIRFRDRFDYSVDIENDCRGSVMPNLLVQPIVENAVLHGVERSRQPCTIRVLVRSGRNGLRIAVIDNGAGIERERLNSIRAELHDGADTSLSYGLKNVHERLRLRYGSPCGVTIYSRVNRGTLVRLQLPRPEAEEVRNA